MSGLFYEPIPLPDVQCVWWEYFSPMEEIPLADLAALTAKEEIDDGVRVFKTRLEATLRCDIAARSEPHYYRVTDTQGKAFLIGLPTPPFPIAHTETHIDSHPSGIAAATFRLEWTHLYGPLEIL